MSKLPPDPTTAAIADLIAERDRLRAENRVLCKTVVAAYADLDLVTADRDRLAKIGEGVAAGAIRQTVREIRDHFVQIGAQEVADVIEKLWGRGLPS